MSERMVYRKAKPEKDDGKFESGPGHELKTGNGPGPGSHRCPNSKPEHKCPKQGSQSTDQRPCGYGLCRQGNGQGQHQAGYKGDECFRSCHSKSIQGLIDLSLKELATPFRTHAPGLWPGAALQDREISGAFLNKVVVLPHKIARQHFTGIASSFNLYLPIRCMLRYQQEVGRCGL